jgi:hypothetical protein
MKADPTILFARVKTALTHSAPSIKTKRWLRENLEDLGWEPTVEFRLPGEGGKITYKKAPSDIGPIAPGEKIVEKVYKGPSGSVKTQPMGAAVDVGAVMKEPNIGKAVLREGGLTREFLPKLKGMQALKKILGKAGLIAGGTGLALGGMSGAKYLHQKIMEPMAFKKDFGKMLTYDPSLKKYDPSQVEARFRTLRTFNKPMSEDPLVSSSFVRQTMEYPVVTPAVLRDVHPAPHRGGDTGLAKLVSSLIGGSLD